MGGAGAIPGVGWGNWVDFFDFFSGIEIHCSGFVLLLVVFNLRTGMELVLTWVVICEM